MAKVKLFDEKNGTYKFKCPAGHWHYINTKVPNHLNAQWNFNGDVNNPTFTPSINEKTGYYVNPEMYAEAKKYSYQCHFVITNGKIHFCSDCSHGLAGQTVDLPEMD